jgi:6-pyruvoyltetrahydropterin/6-carboxytetrahydropterin synthase
MTQWIAITRHFEFDAGHRLVGHEGKCRFLHGHRYKAEYTMVPAGGACWLDSVGRVLDFGVIKKRVGEWINDNWDHNLVLNQDDPLLSRQVMETATHRQSKFASEVFQGRWPYVMKSNPTAENMVVELYEKTHLLLPEVRIIQVRLWETPNCHADFQPLCR